MCGVLCVPKRQGPAGAWLSVSCVSCLPAGLAACWSARRMQVHLSTSTSGDGKERRDAPSLPGQEGAPECCRDAPNMGKSSTEPSASSASKSSLRLLHTSSFSGPGHQGLLLHLCRAYFTPASRHTYASPASCHYACCHECKPIETTLSREPHFRATGTDHGHLVGWVSLIIVRIYVCICSLRSDDSVLSPSTETRMLQHLSNLLFASISDKVSLRKAAAAMLPPIVVFLRTR